MAFPDSPLNGEIHTEFGREFIYEGNYPDGQWLMVPVALDQIGYFNFNNIQEFANEAAASGLATNTPYRTATGELRIKL